LPALHLGNGMTFWERPDKEIKTVADLFHELRAAPNYATVRAYEGEGGAQIQIISEEGTKMRTLYTNWK
jgi:hypothetical protein